MTTGGLIDRIGVCAYAAVVAAQAQAGSEKFRQRDVRFFIDLASNWTDCRDCPQAYVQNTQVQRFLEGLCRTGILRKSAKPTPAYRLTPAGVVELMRRMTDVDAITPRALIFFVLYFVQNYGDMLRELATAEGSPFPPALETELNSLLDYEALLTRCIKRAEQDLKAAKERTERAHEAAVFAGDFLKKNRNLDVLISEFGRRFPYGLNSQKPLRELLVGFTPELRMKELTICTRRRADIIWRPLEKSAQVFLDSLKNLSSGPV